MRGLMQRIIVLLIVVGNCFFSVALAEEAILSFKSDIRIYRDASANVTETILVTAEQEQIRHGIFRQLLVYFYDPDGKKHFTRYYINHVFNNSQPSPFHLGRTFNSLDIYVGDKDIVLTPGNYLYTLQYHVKNAVRFLADRDEFYWNITGNNWKFPIYRVEADITFPTDIRIAAYAAYTGVLGSKDKNSTVELVAPNQLHVVTNHTLLSGEGLTVAIDWPKGLIYQPTLWQQLTHGSYFLAVQVILFLIGYFIAVLYWESREPDAGAIVPLFEPPPSVSPAAMRYIYKMRFDDKTFTTAIVSMATKGYLAIQQDQHDFTLIKKSKDTSMLSHGELALATSLFANQDMITLTNSSSVSINFAKKALKNRLRTEFENIYFLTNNVYLIPAFLLSTLAILGIAMDVMGGLSQVWQIFFLLCFLCLIVATIPSDFAVFIRACLYKTGHIVSNLWGMVKLFLIGIVLLVVCMQYFQLMTLTDVVFLIIIIVINTVFYHLLKSRTPKGRKLMDQIEGFKLYLMTTENDRFNRLNPPTDTPALYEKYFPYALALDVENEWGKRFETVLQQANTLTQHYQPTWYVGQSWGSNSLPVFSAAMVSSVAYASSSTVGGGGSSGGGGGGGGGGGW
jgi:uncharacterized membrane protein